MTTICRTSGSDPGGSESSHPVSGFRGFGVSGFSAPAECRATVSKQRDEEQFDLFVPFITNPPLRDQRETMERPFFSLAKRKRLQPIDYTSPDGSTFVKVRPHSDYGMATIWDADILIWADPGALELCVGDDGLAPAVSAAAAASPARATRLRKSAKAAARWARDLT